MRQKFQSCVILLAVFIIFLFTASFSFADPLTNAKNAANSLGSTFQGTYGSQAGIQQNVSNPMTSSNTQMTTLDKSKSFNAQLTCPSSKAFLTVLAPPSGTGDLMNVTILEDLNMDGNIEYNYAVSQPIAGVCANGFISCDAGTWNNCAAYQWIADSTGKVTAAASLLTDLGGCYCINQSCGSNLVWNNLGEVLKDLGGGIVGAIQSSNPQLAISNVSTDGPSIYYYGQQSGGCSSAGGGAGTSTPQQYYSNPASISSDAQSLALTQQSDPTSYYSMLSNAQKASTGNVQVQQCSIYRPLQCSGVLPGYTDNVTDNCLSLETNTDCLLEDETVDGVQTMRDGASTGLNPLAPSCDSVTIQQIAPCSGFSGSINWPGSHFLRFVGKGNQILVQFISDTCMCVTSTGVINLPLGATASGSTNDISFYQDSRAQTIRIVGKGGSLDFYDQSGTYEGSVTLTGATISGTASFNSSGSCSPFTIYGSADQLYFQTANCGSYALNITSNCPLGSQYACISRSQSDVMSGATVNGTNYTCPIDTSNGGDQICYTSPTTDTVCPDFLEKDRTYYCTSSASFDFSGVQKRVANVTATAANNGSSMYYQDLTPDASGTWTTTDVNSNLPAQDTVPDCELACKTEKAVTDSQTSILGSTSTNASQYQQNNTQSEAFYYKTCVNGVCPVGAGETIVEDCQCIDDFGEAAGVMQSMRMAGQDMICSDGTAKPLQ